MSPDPPRHDGKDIVYEQDYDVMAGKLIEDNWALTKYKPKVYYDENVNPRTHNFQMNPIAIKVVVGEERSRPLGIGMDGEAVARVVTYTVQAIRRETIIAADNEIRRIMATHRFNPMGIFQTVTYVRETPGYGPTFNYWQKGLTYVFKTPYHALPAKLIYD